MKKLRATAEEKTKFIEDLTEQLAWFNRAPLSDFKINDLIKEYSKVPENIKKPILLITAEAYVRMLELINQSPVECSWHGLVETAGNKYYITDILVFPQRNSATATTTDEKEFAEWQTKLIMDPKFPIEKLRMHGHSHVNMNVFSSGVDDQYQKDLITKVDDGDFYIFLIMNKKMEMCAFIYDFKQQVMFETADIDIRIVNDLVACEDLRGWAKEELKQNAITERPATAKTYPRYDYAYERGFYENEKESYFSKANPIFKGANNGFK